MAGCSLLGTGALTAPAQEATSFWHSFLPTALLIIGILLFAVIIVFIYKMTENKK